MAHPLSVALRAGAPGQLLVYRLRRAAMVAEVFLADLEAQLAAARREYRLRRSLRGLDRRLLQDLGLDRGRC